MGWGVVFVLWIELFTSINYVLNAKKQFLSLENSKFRRSSRKRAVTVISSNIYALM